MKRKMIIIIIVLTIWCPVSSQTGQYSIQTPVGFCYSEYSYQGQTHPICYRNTSMEKNQFHFFSQNRHFILLHSEKKSLVNYDQRILLYDTRNNSIKEIDSCTRNSANNPLHYLGIDGDTLYIHTVEPDTIWEMILSAPETIQSTEAKKYSILHKVALLPSGSTWCVSPRQDKAAYANNENGEIRIVFSYDSGSVPPSIGVGEVLAWTDNNHLLYANIIVEGYGDLFYDLLEYDVEKNASRTVVRHVDNIFDYHDDILVYGESPNRIDLAQIVNGKLSNLMELDFADQFDWIYTAYLLNENELVIGGDRHGFETFYYKCIIQVDTPNQNEDK